MANLNASPSFHMGPQDTGKWTLP